MKNEYIEERKSLVEEIESEFTGLIAGGSLDDECSEYKKCLKECDERYRGGDDGEEDEECFDECAEEYECGEED